MIQPRGPLPVPRSIKLEQGPMSNLNPILNLNPIARTRSIEPDCPNPIPNSISNPISSPISSPISNQSDLARTGSRTRSRTRSPEPDLLPLRSFSPASGLGGAAVLDAKSCGRGGSGLAAGKTGPSGSQSPRVRRCESWVEVVREAPSGSSLPSSNGE